MRRLILAIAAFVLLTASPAFAANRVWVAECGTLGDTSSGNEKAQVCAIPFLADSGPLDATTLKNVVVTNQTHLVRVCAESQTSFRGAITAVTTDSPIFAGQCEYFGVRPSSTVSVIASP